MQAGRYGLSCSVKEEVRPVNRKTFLLNGLLIFAILSLSPAASKQTIAKPTVTERLKAMREETYAATKTQNVKLVFAKATAELRFAEEQLGPDSREALSALDFLISLDFETTRYVDAERHLVRLVDAQTRLFGRDDINTLASLNLLGRAYSRNSDYVKAEAAYREVAERRERTRGKEHPTTLTAFSNLAQVRFDQGMVQESEDLATQILKNRERLFGFDDGDTLVSVNNLAFIYETQGRYAEAEAFYIRALEGNERKYGSQYIFTINSLHNLGAFYLQQRRFAEAEPLIKRALESEKSDEISNEASAIRSITNLAILFEATGRLKESESAHRRNVTDSAQILGKGQINALNARFNLGSFLTRQGRPTEALPHQKQVAAELKRTLPMDHPLVLLSDRNLAKSLALSNRWSEAEPLLRRAQQRTIATRGVDYPDAVEASSELADLYLSRAGKAKLAINAARDYSKGTKLRRSRLVRQSGSNRSTATSIFPTHDGFITLADGLWIHKTNTNNFDNEAFEALQDSVMGTTNAAVADAAARRAADKYGRGASQLVRERQDLVQRLLGLNRTFASQANQTENEAIKRRATIVVDRTQTENRLKALDSKIANDFPAFYALIDPTALNLAATQRLLSDDEAILLIVPGPRGTHIIAINRQESRWSRTSVNEAMIGAKVNRLLWDLGAPVEVDPATEQKWVSENGAGTSFDRATAHALYELIVDPIGPLIKGKKHLFVITGGELSRLPLGVLVTKKPEGNDAAPAALRSTDWFADQHSIAVLPSIQSLKLLREGRPKRTMQRGRRSSFIGFGDPLLQGKAELRGGDNAPQRSRGVQENRAEVTKLARLPGTAEELESMRKAFGAPSNSVYLRIRATEGALKQLDLSSVSILAFATHGLLGGTLAGVAEPALVMTPPKRVTELDDGLLTSSEAAALKLNADWVILSACNTAAGDGTDSAPTLSGLARSFLFAGARSLLVSHWPVLDSVAKQLTVEAVRLKQINPSLGRAEALQQAMRSVRNNSSHDHDENWAHPAAWAPFSLVGDGAE
jgi:CHAT domain-containing protein/tetratricopeptide (TPR) repeat protein